jgi:hypothetical protein
VRECTHTWPLTEAAASSLWPTTAKFSLHMRTSEQWSGSSATTLASGGGSNKKSSFQMFIRRICKKNMTTVSCAVAFQQILQTHSTKQGSVPSLGTSEKQFNLGHLACAAPKSKYSHKVSCTADINISGNRPSKHFKEKLSSTSGQVVLPTMIDL